MTTNRFFIRQPQSCRYRVRGATLMEVIVSVFLLTFGVLGLMAAQIRSVAGISEAESRSTIAQAAETLAEGMLANPKIVQSADRAVRRYPDYTKSANVQKIDMTAENTLPPPLWGSDWAGDSKQVNISKQNLAANQISIFEYLLRQTPNAESIQYVICEESNYPPVQAGVDAAGNLQPNCGASKGGSTVIKVVWTTRPPKEGETANAYSYLLQVQE